MTDTDIDTAPKVRRRTAAKLKPGDEIAYGGRTVEVVAVEALELVPGPRGLLDDADPVSWVVLELLEPGFGRFRLGVYASRKFELVSS